MIRSSISHVAVGVVYLCLL